jgi:pseudouridine-5'-phosphate glycosidase
MPNSSDPVLRVAPPVAEALRHGRPVVALESSVLAQGLPIPANRDAAERMVSAVETRGAVPAITGVVRGTPTVGLEPDELERFLARDGVRKVSARDIPAAVAQAADGATTVAAAISLASRAGVAVFSTGGIGGVHRDAPFDESADLLELSRTTMIVVCAGAKSILDLRATAERLETLGIPVVGFRTDELPGFFFARTGIPLGTRAEHVRDIVRMFSAHRSLGRTQAMVVVQPPPEHAALDRRTVEEAVARAQQEAHRQQVSGSDLTPYLLGALNHFTEGSSLKVNVALLEANAALATEIAIELAGEAV